MSNKMKVVFVIQNAWLVLFGATVSFSSEIHAKCTKTQSCCCWNI